MQAFKLTGPGQIVPFSVDIPKIQDHEVLIRIASIGLCGSDLHLFRGDYRGPSKYPIQFGHEWSGTVVSVGPGVQDLAAGDKVTGDCSRYCDACPNCAIDRNLCSHIEKFGITIDGASSAYIIRDRKYLYKAEPDMDLALLSLAEPIAVAKHLAEKVRQLSGDLEHKKILIYGGGPIGQAVLLMLTDLFGCRDVEMAEIIESRLALGVLHGARPAGLPNPDPGAGSVSDAGNVSGANARTAAAAVAATVGAGADYASLYQSARYDVVIETTGSPAVFARSFHLLKPMGTLGCLGMAGSAEIPQSLIVTKSLRIIGTIGGTGEFEDVIRYIYTHPEKVSRLISHRFQTDEVEQAFNTAMNERSAIKVNLSLS